MPRVLRQREAIGVIVSATVVGVLISLVLHWAGARKRRAVGYLWRRSRSHSICKVRMGNSNQLRG
jgi:hypothetical protein